ncbi:TRAP transporter small permease subunit [Paraburkholderia acidisoli]|uniref:TRAP transporter small permease protein n=1 Tax=Paraburkholderia acidisoli TaxID=2571748 RepID=A0A7Z2JK58_9BURK|nr:TRAP transporter small permease [Paraburkholderia acidisoli]QGZ66095.1 TRAP transporter small permease subunit [Paraburkholderia acidisoli]
MSLARMPRVLRSILRVTQATRRGLGRLSSWMNAAAGWSYLAVALFVTCDVVSRKVFGFSSGSTTQIAGYVLACGITWGLAHTMYERAHIRIDILVMRLPLRVRQYMHVIALTLLLVFIGFLAYSGVNLSSDSAMFQSTDLSALAMPLVIPQSIWTFGLAFFTVVLATMLVETLVLLLLGEARAIDALLAHDEAEAEQHEMPTGERAAS